MISTILNHRSIRKYKSTPVPDADLNEILEAGIRASTTGNMQVYSILVTRDPEKKKKLWESHFKQEMVLQAPVHLTFCADFNRFNTWCRYRNAVPGYDNFLSFFTAAIDALLVAQNVVLAAESKGLGICYLGTTTYMAKNFIQILGLPKGVVPVTAITLGYPDEQPAPVNRLPLNAVVHHETYHNYTREDIQSLYLEKESLKETQELLRINNKETLAQIFTDLRYKKKDNIAFSLSLLNVLKEQGFMNHEE